MDKRQSNFELLRIVLMFFIIGLHIMVHGGLYKTVSIFSMNYYLLHLAECFCLVAVNCFVLLSGYFGIRNPGKKALKLEMQLLFYSFLITLAFYLFPAKQISVTSADLIFSLFPVLLNKWWFVSIYAVLMVLSPFINKMIASITEKEFRQLLLIFLMVFSVVPTLYAFITSMNFFPTIGFYLIKNNQGYSLYNFVFMYLIGAYLGKYKESAKVKSPVFYALQYAAFVGLNFLYSILLDWLTRKQNNIFLAYDNILVILGTVAFFRFFQSLQVLPKLAGAVGVYQ